jgi:hypothetical protein
VIDDAVAALAQGDQARRSRLPDGRRREVRQLFRLVLRCVRAGRAKLIIRPSEQDTMARTYVALAARDRDSEQPADEPATGYGDCPGGTVQTAIVGQVGVITLGDRDKRNAIGAEMTSRGIAALESLRARQVRTVVLRAAPGMNVWSAGHDIGELPVGQRDPLGYDDPLEELIRAVRTFPAPVVAMAHGTVWGGALNLVLSCG